MDFPDTDEVLSRLDTACDGELPLESLVSRIEALLSQFKDVTGCESATDTVSSLQKALEQTTAYSLTPDILADSADSETVVFRYPLASNLLQAQALLTHFIHYHINSCHQEIRLITLRLLVASRKPEDVAMSATELRLRIQSLHGSIQRAYRTYRKLLSGLSYSPAHASSSSRYVDTIVADTSAMFRKTKAELTLDRAQLQNVYAHLPADDPTDAISLDSTQSTTKPATSATADLNVPLVAMSKPVEATDSSDSESSNKTADFSVPLTTPKGETAGSTRPDSVSKWNLSQAFDTVDRERSSDVDPSSDDSSAGSEQADDAAQPAAAEGPGRTLHRADFKPLVQYLCRPPDFPAELSTKLYYLKDMCVGEITRRSISYNDKYLTTTHTQFHADYPYLYTEMDQLGASLLSLSESYNIMLDPFKETAEFYSRATKIVSSSVNTLIRFFATLAEPPADDTVLATLDYSAGPQNVDDPSAPVLSSAEGTVGSLVQEEIDSDFSMGSYVQWPDPAGYTRAKAMGAPDFSVGTPGNDAPSGEGLYARACDTENITGPLRELRRYYTDRGAAYPYTPIFTPDDSGQLRAQQMRRITAAPLLLVDYDYAHKAPSANSNDSFDPFSMVVHQRGAPASGAPQHDVDVRQSSDILPGAFSRAHVFLPAEPFPVFTTSLDYDRVEARLKEGPSAVRKDFHIFTSKTVLYDQLLIFDINLVKSCFLDFRDYLELHSGAADAAVGDVLRSVSKSINGRVGLHASYAHGKLPSNLLYLHYFMLYGKIIHLRARILSHLNHLEYVRAFIDSDLSLNNFGLSYETAVHKPFSPPEFQRFLSEFAASPESNMAQFSSPDSRSKAGRTGRFGVLGFKRIAGVADKVSLKANDITTPNGNRILFKEALRMLTDVIEHSFLLVGSALVRYFSSRQAFSPDTAGASDDARRQEESGVDRLVILLHLYEQELCLIEQKRFLCDSILQCYLHTLDYVDAQAWLGYVAGVIALRPSYDPTLLERTNDLNCFSGCQALVLHLKQLNAFVRDFISYTIADNKREASESLVFQYASGASAEPPMAVPTAAPMAARDTVQFDLSNSNSLSESSAPDAVETGNRVSAENVSAKAPVLAVSRDKVIPGFPRLAAFRSPEYSHFAGLTVCDIHPVLGRLVRILCELAKVPLAYKGTYLLSADGNGFERDICAAAVYETACCQMHYVAVSRRNRGCMGTLPQSLLKICRFGVYGIPQCVWRGVRSVDSVCNALSILYAKRNLALLTSQTVSVVQSLGSSLAEVGRKLAKLSVNRISWQNSDLGELLPLYQQDTGGMHGSCKPTEASYDYAVYLEDFSRREFTNTLDLYYLPDDFDFEQCLIDPLHQQVLTLLRAATPARFDAALYALGPAEEQRAGSQFQLSGAAGDQPEERGRLHAHSVLASRPSDQVRSTTEDSVSTVGLLARSLDLAHSRSQGRVGSSQQESIERVYQGHEVVSSVHPLQQAHPDLLYRRCTPHGFLPNFLSPTIASDIEGAFCGFAILEALHAAKDPGSLPAMRHHPSLFSPDYKTGISGIVNMASGKAGFETIRYPNVQELDPFEKNPLLYLDSPIGFLQRMVFLQAAGLNFYKALLHELTETALVHIRNLNLACEVHTRQRLMAERVDLSKVSHYVIADNVPESTTFFITQQGDTQRDPVARDRGAPSSKSIPDCFLSFLVIAAESRYVWSQPLYMQSRQCAVPIMDRLSAGVDGMLLLFERTRAVEACLLSHRDRSRRRRHLHGEISRSHGGTGQYPASSRTGSFSTVRRDNALTPRGGPNPASHSGEMSFSLHMETRSLSMMQQSALALGRSADNVGGVHDIEEKLDLHTLDVIGVAHTLLAYSRVHLLRSQLATILNGLGRKHRALLRPAVEGGALGPLRPDPLSKAATGAPACACAHAPEHDALELLTALGVASGRDAITATIPSAIGVYDPATFGHRATAGAHYPGPGNQSERSVDAASFGARQKPRMLELCDFLCLSPFLLDALAHEGLPAMLFHFRLGKQSEAGESTYHYVPNLLVVPPSTAARHLMAGKTMPIMHVVTVLTGLIHLYSAYLHVFDVAGALDELHRATTIGIEECCDTQDFTQQAADLLRQDSSSEFLQQAQENNVFVTALALGKGYGPDGACDAEGNGHDPGNDNGGEAQGDCAGVDERGLSADGALSLQPSQSLQSPDAPDLGLSPQPRPRSARALSSLEQTLASIPEETQRESLGDIVHTIDDAFDIEREFDYESDKRELRHLSRQLQLIAGTEAPTLARSPYVSRSPLIAFFARLLFHMFRKMCDAAVRSRADPLRGERSMLRSANMATSSSRCLPNTADTYISQSVLWGDGDSTMLTVDGSLLENASALNAPTAACETFATEDSSASEEDTFLQHLTLAGGNPFVRTSSLVSVIKVATAYRDFAFERLFGYVMLCANKADACRDMQSIVGTAETLGLVRLITGYEFTGDVGLSRLLGRIFTNLWTVDAGGSTYNPQFLSACSSANAQDTTTTLSLGLITPEFPPRAEGSPHNMPHSLRLALGASAPSRAQSVAFMNSLPLTATGTNIGELTRLDGPTIQEYSILQHVAPSGAGFLDEAFSGAFSGACCPPSFATGAVGYSHYDSISKHKRFLTYLEVLKGGGSKPDSTTARNSSRLVESATAGQVQKAQQAARLASAVLTPGNVGAIVSAMYDGFHNSQYLLNDIKLHYAFQELVIDDMDFVSLYASDGAPCDELSSSSVIEPVPEEGVLSHGDAGVSVGAVRHPSLSALARPGGGTPGSSREGRGSDAGMRATGRSTSISSVGPPRSARHASSMTRSQIFLAGLDRVSALDENYDDAISTARSLTASRSQKPHTLVVDATTSIDAAILPLYCLIMDLDVSLSQVRRPQNSNAVPHLFYSLDSWCLLAEGIDRVCLFEGEKALGAPLAGDRSEFAALSQRGPRLLSSDAYRGTDRSMFPPPAPPLSASLLDQSGQQPDLFYDLGPAGSAAAETFSIAPAASVASAASQRGVCALKARIYRYRIIAESMRKRFLGGGSSATATAAAAAAGLGPASANIDLLNRASTITVDSALDITQCGDASGYLQGAADAQPANWMLSEQPFSPQYSDTRLSVERCARLLASGSYAPLPSYGGLLGYHLQASAAADLCGAAQRRHFHAAYGEARAYCLETIALVLERVLSALLSQRYQDPAVPGDDPALRCRLTGNRAPVYPLVPGGYGLAPLEATLPYDVADSTQATRFLQQFLGRHMITVDQLTTAGVSSSGKTSNLVLLTNFSFASMMDKFKSLVFGTLQSVARTGMTQALYNAALALAQVKNAWVVRGSADALVRKTLNTLDLRVSDAYGAYLYTLRAYVGRVATLQTNLAREARLLPALLRSSVARIYEDALALLFCRILAERELFVDFKDDICAGARRVVVGERIRAFLRLAAKSPDGSKFFLECADREKRVAFLEEAVVLEHRLLRKAASFGALRVGRLARGVESDARLFEGEHRRLHDLCAVYAQLAGAHDQTLRIALAGATETLRRLLLDHRAAQGELADRICIVSRNRRLGAGAGTGTGAGAGTGGGAGSALTSIVSLAPLGALAQAMALPPDLRVDIGRMRGSLEAVQEEVHVYRAEIHDLKRSLAKEGARAADAARGLRLELGVLRARRASLVAAANSMVQSNDFMLREMERGASQKADASKAEYYALLNHMRRLKNRARELELAYRGMVGDIRTIRAEGERFLMGGLTPLGDPARGGDCGGRGGRQSQPHQ